MMSIGADVTCGRSVFRLDTETDAESIVRTDRLTGQCVIMKTVDIEPATNVQFNLEIPFLTTPMTARAEVLRELEYCDPCGWGFWGDETVSELSLREHGHKLANFFRATCFNDAIASDQGAVHGSEGLHQEEWAIFSNWRSAMRNESFVKASFHVTSKRTHVLNFSMRTLPRYILMQFLVGVPSKVKRRHLSRRGG